MLDKQKNTEKPQTATHTFVAGKHVQEKKNHKELKRSETRIIKMKTLQVLAGVNADVLGTTATHLRGTCFSKSSV